MAYQQQQAPPMGAPTGLTPPPLKRPCDYPLEDKLWQLDGDDCCLCFRLETGVRILLAFGIFFGALSLILLMAGAGAAVGMDKNFPAFALFLGAMMSLLDMVFSIFGWQASNDRIPQKAIYYLWWRLAALVLGVLHSLIIIGSNGGVGVAGLLVGGAIRIYFLCAVATWTKRMILERSVPTGGNGYDMEVGHGQQPPMYGWQPNQQQQFQQQQPQQQFQQQPQQHFAPAGHVAVDARQYPTLGQPQQGGMVPPQHQPVGGQFAPQQPQVPHQQQPAAPMQPHHVTPGEAPPAEAVSHGPTTPAPSAAGTYQPL